MDINAISQLISSVGFPIACCGACFWYINKSANQHQEEMLKMSEAINNNTIAMTRLAEKIEGGKDE